MSNRFSRLMKHDREIRRDERKVAKLARKLQRQAEERHLGHPSADDPTAVMAEAERAQ